MINEAGAAVGPFPVSCAQTVSHLVLTAEGMRHLNNNLTNEETVAQLASKIVLVPKYHILKHWRTANVCCSLETWPH